MVDRVPDPVYVLRGHEDEITSLSCLYDKDAATSDLQVSLASGDASGSLIVWSLQRKRPRLSIKPHLSSVLACCMYGKDEIATLGREGTGKIINLATGAIKSEFAACEGTFCGLAVLENSSVVVPWGEDHALALVKPGESAGGRPNCIFSSSLRGMPMAVATASRDDEGDSAAGDGARRSLEHNFFAAHEDGSAAEWDVRSPGAPVAVMKLSQDPLLSVAVGCGGELVVVGGVENKLWYLDWVSGASPKLIMDRKGSTGTQSLAVRYDGELVVAGNWDSKVRLFSRDGEVLAVTSEHQKSVVAITFLAGAQRGLFATASRDKRIALWDMYEKSVNASVDEYDFVLEGIEDELDAIEKEL